MSSFFFVIFRFHELSELYNIYPFAKEEDSLSELLKSEETSIDHVMQGQINLCPMFNVQYFYILLKISTRK